VLRVRTLSRLGFDVRVGIGPSITIAATASGQVPPPGGLLTIAPDVADWLGPLPVEALHGIGPPATVQRLLGGRAGRLAADHARGIEPRPVVPRTLSARAPARH
jgi:DNA polymerase-4